MGRAPCCDKANVKKGPWSPEEDSKLKEYMEKYGTGGNWIALPQKAGLKRCGKSCRLRWLNYLRPNIKHGEFSDEEDRVICSLFANIGSRWSIIAAQLPGRTDNDIKNYWNTKLKKKLMGFVNPNCPNNYNNNSQRKIPSLPFPNNIISSHETTPPTSTSTTTSSSFSQSQPLLMSSSLVHKDHNQYPNYTSYYTTSTPVTCTRSSVFSLSGLETQVSTMVSSNYSNSTSTSCSNSAFSTNLYSSIFQAQDYYNLQCCNNYPLKENNNNSFIMFGSEASCSTSSEGSCNYQIKQEEMGHSFHHQNQAYDMGNVATFDHQDHINQRFMHNYYGGGSNNNTGDHHVHDCNYLSFWGQKSNGYFGETALDIDHQQQYHVLLQDVKQLISSGNTGTSEVNNIIDGSNNFFNI